jgi:PERQ amino acid-rich with GYF domain-containing protein
LFRGAPQAPPPPPTTTSIFAAISPEKAKSTENSIMSLASIQAEQTRLESTQTKAQGGQATTMSQKMSQQTPPKLVGGSTANTAEQQQQQKNSNSTSWAAWGNSAATNNLKSNMNDFSLAHSLNGPTPAAAAAAAAANPGFSSSHNYTNNSNATSNSITGGFWGELNETKKTNANGNKANSNSNNKTSTKSNKSNAKNQPFPDLQQNSSQNHHTNIDSNFHHSDKPMSKQQKKIASVEESVQHAFLRNMTISEEFMKWCQDQLQYFHVDLHIPTFVNFLREIETCAEIEDYVINYLGDSQQAKDFAQQFFINRESQISQQSNHNEDLRENDDSNSQFQTKGDTQFSKQRQKKRSKGQRLDSQLLGFTVQPDPNLKNRGDIDPL